MKILVINAGSSTLKFQLLETTSAKVLAKGNVERIGEGKSFLRYKANGKEVIVNDPIDNHAQAMTLVLAKLTDSEVGVVKDIKDIKAFGHRVVNVGDKYFDPILVTKEVLEDFKTRVDFSPLHVPGAIAGMEGAMSVSSEIPNVAVFDIGFHKTLPDYAYRYAIPKRYYEEYAIRRYGAHGTSHYFVANECARVMGKDIKDLKIITCHIGSGASITAVDGGKSIDTSMGFTPLEGIMMNTRSGDIDPAVVEFICKKEGKSVSEVLKIFNKESGLIGVNGKASDMREILELRGDPDIELSLNMYAYRIKKYIGAYTAAMGGLDAVVFTAGVGEHTPEVREMVSKNMGFFGWKVDNKKNYAVGRDEIAEITAKGSKVRTFVIPTDEEYVIAKETEKIVKSRKNK